MGLGVGRIPEEAEAEKAHYRHLTSCLRLASYILGSLPPEFNQAIRYSIAAIAEIFATAIKQDRTELRESVLLAQTWGKEYINRELKQSMLHRGWCPSDVSRIDAKYGTLQGLSLITKMDKLPKRDHGNCTDHECKLYQIDIKTYELYHEQQGCLCKQLSVEEEELIEILKGPHFPVLRLRGDQ